MESGRTRRRLWPVRRDMQRSLRGVILIRLFEFDPSRLVRLVSEIDKLRLELLRAPSVPGLPPATAGREWEKNWFLAVLLARQSPSPSRRAGWGPNMEVIRSRQ